MLNQRIKTFYDSSSAVWEKVWGEHMHHGFYENGNANKDRRQAQIDLITELYQWARVSATTSQILDVGCGIGGSSLELAARLPMSQVLGITLSPVQANRATARARQFGSRVQFLVADAMTMPFESDRFDLIWSLESGEHMADKTKFLAECLRVLKPNGQLIFATWCHRDTSTKPLTDNERQHLERIYDVYCLPYVISLPEYESITQGLGFQAIRTVDWSKEVAPFWDRVIESAFSFTNLMGVLQAGLPTIRATAALRLMSRGYERGLIKFGVLTAFSPAKNQYQSHS